MDQKTINTATGLRVAIIKAKWHSHIVEQCYEHCKSTLLSNAKDNITIDAYDVPGALEIPLLAQDIARTGKYDAIIATAFVVDGGIYRHDFVASSVLEAMMRVQLETGVPIFSVVLAPHQYQDTKAHNGFFHEHFQLKGREAADSCLEFLEARQAVMAIA